MVEQNGVTELETLGAEEQEKPTCSNDTPQMIVEKSIYTIRGKQVIELDRQSFISLTEAMRILSPQSSNAARWMAQRQEHFKKEVDFVYSNEHFPGKVGRIWITLPEGLMTLAQVCKGATRLKIPEDMEENLILFLTDYYEHSTPLPVPTDEGPQVETPGKFDTANVSQETKPAETELLDDEPRCRVETTETFKRDSASLSSLEQPLKDEEEGLDIEFEKDPYAPKTVVKTQPLKDDVASNGCPDELTAKPDPSDMMKERFEPEGMNDRPDSLINNVKLYTDRKILDPVLPLRTLTAWSEIQPKLVECVTDFAQQFYQKSVAMNKIMYEAPEEIYDLMEGAEKLFREKIVMNHVKMIRDIISDIISAETQ